MTIQQMLLGRSQPLDASASPTFASSNQVGGTRPSAKTTNSVAITPTGGSGTYTYAWTRLSGSALPLINSTTTDSASWSRTEPLNTATYSAVWRCTVSDGATTKTVDVNVTMTWEI